MKNKQNIYDQLRVELFQFLKSGHTERDSIVQSELQTISNTNVAFAHYIMNEGFDSSHVIMALGEKFD